ncbi:MAG: bifunctional phosphoglucose/phosphomannose isomerase [Candidatus Parcubacteria bacterium]|nr:MAG: bifunctional phosphoglucose/phosphomannose isomerase [Candidatus Parcubacteria bacterium]
MNLITTLKNFKNHLKYKPVIQNYNNFSYHPKFLIIGMGGSHLAGDLLKIYNPSLDLFIRQNYNLPPLNLQSLKKYLIIFISYSGNTEEVISACEESIKKQLKNQVVISKGGKLLEIAKKYKIPYIQLPDIDTQPRFATVVMIKALLKVMKQNKALKELEDLANYFNPLDLREKGKIFAQKLFGYIPIIYASENNFALAYNWKIKFNETSKIPAFCNFFPELNHNEMSGFDFKTSNNCFKKFYFLFLFDDSDDERIKKRMLVLEKILQEKNFVLEKIILKQYQNIFYKIFDNLIFGDWVTYYLAQLYKVDPENVVLIERFKKLIKETDIL